MSHAEQSSPTAYASVITHEIKEKVFLQTQESDQTAQTFSSNKGITTLLSSRRCAHVLNFNMLLEFTLCVEPACSELNIVLDSFSLVFVPLLHVCVHLSRFVWAITSTFMHEFQKNWLSCS